jgi:hypothetical protein
MDGLGFTGFHELGEPYTLKEARALLPKGVALIGNSGQVLFLGDFRLKVSLQIYS